MYSSNSLLQSEDSENSTGSCGPVQRNLGSVSGFLDLWYLEKEGLLKTSNIPLPFPLVQYGHHACQGMEKDNSQSSWLFLWSF